MPHVFNVRIMSKKTSDSNQRLQKTVPNHRISTIIEVLQNFMKSGKMKLIDRSYKDINGSKKENFYRFLQLILHDHT